MKPLFLTVRFLMELAALAALAYGGFHVEAGLAIRILLAIVLPILAATIWGIFVAPRSQRRLPNPWRLIPELVVFGGATVALAAAHQQGWTIAFAIGAVIAVVGDRF